MTTMTQYRYLERLCPNAVYALGRWQTICDFLAVAEGLVDQVSDLHELTVAIECFEDSVDKMAAPHGVAFRKVLANAPQKLGRMADLDVARRAPDAIVSQARSHYVLGALAALAACKAAIGYARALSTGSGQLYRLMLASMHTEQGTALALWTAAVEEMNRVHPWLKATPDTVRLVDTQSAAPRFQVGVASCSVADGAA